MASIKDALEESLNEPNSLLKFFIFTLPVFGAFCCYMNKMQNSVWFYILAFLSFIVILGTMARCANNVMNYRDYTLPTFNVFTLFFDAIRSIIALIPALAVNGGIAWFVITKLVPMISVEPVAKGVTYITYAVCGAILLTVFMLFCKKFSFANVFDLKAISDSCIDVMIQMIWMVVQIAIIDAVIAGSLTYLFWLFIGIENVVMYFVWCMTVVFNAALVGNYLGQLNYEALHQEEEKTKKKKEKEELNQLKKS